MSKWTAIQELLNFSFKTQPVVPQGRAAMVRLFLRKGPEQCASLDSAFNCDGAHLAGAENSQRTRRELAKNSPCENFAKKCFTQRIRTSDYSTTHPNALSTTPNFHESKDRD